MAITEQISNALADRYRIERQVGEGGMATVYLAHDLKHDRRVALKVLRPELAAIIGAERFLNEIKVTANLQHPHILPLHDSGDADGLLFYVMPFVEGETLRERLDREKQFAIDDAVEITKSVAAALDYAHRQGVIHRDIKPANILIHDGQAMVADFGIALAVSAAGGSRMTETGLSIGTPHYMSPEQAMGDRELDARADVYSLAAMLYEMLAGDPPYMGSTAQAIIAKVITEKAAPITSYRDTVPAHIEAALTKALAKLPADRFTSAARFAEAIVNPGFTLPATMVMAAGDAPARKRRLADPMTVAAGVLLVTSVGLALWPAAEPLKPIARLNLALPAEEAMQPFVWGVTATLSPDGSRIVYMGPGDQGGQLWSRPMDRLNGTPIPGTEEGYNWSFSPDGQALAFQVGNGVGSIKVVSLSGAPPLTLTDSAQWFGGDWGPDGYVYFTNPQWGLSRIPAGGGAMELVTAVDSTTDQGIHLWPDVLPNGRGVVYTSTQGSAASLQDYSIHVLDLETGESRALLSGVYARYTPSGHLIYVTSEGDVVAVAFDARRLELVGQPTPLLEGISVKQYGAVDLAISDSGSLLYSSGAGTALANTLVWVSRDGTEEVIDPEWIADFGYPALSPDGLHLAVDLNTASGTEVWVKELDRGPQSKLTFTEGVNYRPFWMPDGQSVMFVSNRAGQEDLWVKRADGSAQAQLVMDHDRMIDEGIASPDGEWLIYRAGVGPRDLFARRIGADSVGQPLLADDEYDEYGAAISPDGRWLAYVSNESGIPEVYVRPFPDVSEARWQVSTGGGGTEPVWAHSGRELFYKNRLGELTVARIMTDPTFGVGERITLFPTTATYEGITFHPTYDVTADDQRFVMVKLSGAGGTQQLVLVQNWLEEVKARALRN